MNEGAHRTERKAAEGSGLSFCFAMVDDRYIDGRAWCRMELGVKKCLRGLSGGKFVVSRVAEA